MSIPPDCRVEELLASTPVSRTWRVVADGRPAVLRVDEPGARRLGLDRVAEPGVLAAAAAAGVGPACLAADPARGTLLTGWLPGRAWSAADLKEPGNLRQAAALLRRVHGLPLAAPAIDLAGAIDRYGGPPDRVRAARAQLARCLAGAGAGEGRAGEGLRLCHGDPTPGNFIAGPEGRLHLIDWEYAGLCHPAFDLAGLALGAGLDAAGDEFLLAAYGGCPPGAADRDRHRDWKAFCQALGDLWAGALIE